MVAYLAGEPDLHRVDDPARRFGVTVGRLQRLFADQVGVGPTWVVRRHRLPAAVRAASRGPIGVRALAAELGYGGPAHRTRDSTELTGVPPARYVRVQ